MDAELFALMDPTNRFRVGMSKDPKELAALIRDFADEIELGLIKIGQIESSTKVTISDFTETSLSFHYVKVRPEEEAIVRAATAEEAVDGSYEDGDV